MAAPIGALRAELSASAAQFENDMKRARDAVRINAYQMQNSLDKLGGSFNNVIKSLFSLKTAAAMAAGAGGLVYLINSAVNAADKMGKLAQSAGLPVEKFSTLAYAANLSNVSLEALETALARLSNNMMEAAKGSGDAYEALNLIGIEVRNANGELKSASQIITEVADKFSKMEDGIGKTALAIKIFGRSGNDLIPLLNQGSIGLRELQEEAIKLGLVIDKDTAQAAERFNDNLRRLKLAKQALANMIMKESLPAFEGLVNELAKAQRETNILQEAAKVAGVAFKGLLTGAVAAITIFKSLGDTLAAVANIIWDTVAGAFLQVGKLIGGVAAGIYEGLKGNFKLAKEIFSQVLDDFLAEGKARTGMMANIGSAWMSDLAKNLKAMNTRIGAIWGTTMSDLAKKSKDSGPKIAAPVIEAVDKIKEAIDKQIEALRLQALTFNMSEKNAKLWALALQGATPAQKHLAAEILETIEILKAEKEARELSIKSEKEFIEAADKEIKARHDAEIAIWKKLNAMEAERLMLKMNEKEAELYKLTLEGATKDQLNYAETILDGIAAIKEYQDAQKKAQKIIESVRTPFEVYLDTIKELNDLLNRGLIDWETYMRAAQKAGDKLAEVAKKGKTEFEELKQVIEGWGRDSAAAIVDFCMKGKMSFRSLIDSMIKDFLRMIVYQNLTRPIFSYLGGMVAGAIYGYPGGAATGPSGAYMLHKGGIVGKNGIMRPISQSVLGMANKYHAGLAPDEFPAILKRGEAVFTKEQLRAIGSDTNISITIPINMTESKRRNYGQLQKSLESEIEPVVKKVVERYL